MCVAPWGVQPTAAPPLPPGSSLLLICQLLISLLTILYATLLSSPPPNHNHVPQHHQSRPPSCKVRDFICLKSDSFVFKNFPATCRRQLGQTQEGTPAHSGSHFLPDVQDHQNFLGLVMMSLWLTHHHSLMNIIHIIMSKMYHHNLPNVVEEGVSA